LGLYTLLGFAPLAVNFLVLPVYTARLVPSEFGRLAVVNVAHSFLSLFITVGVDTGYGRLYFDVHKDAAARGRLLATALAFLALSGALWAVLVFTCGEAVFSRAFHDVTLAPYRSALALGATFQVLYTVAYAHFRNGERLRSVAALSLSTSLLSAGAVVVAIYAVRADAPTAFAARNLAFAVAVVPFLVSLVREAWPQRPAWAGVPRGEWALTLKVSFIRERGEGGETRRGRGHFLTAKTRLNVGITISATSDAQNMLWANGLSQNLV